MQVVQLLGGSDGRARMLASAREHLDARRPAARSRSPTRFEGIPDDEELAPPLPDVREEDGWVYSSTPVDVREENGATAIDRLRQAVSPSGELDESMATILLDSVTPEELETEAVGYRRPRAPSRAADHGLRGQRRRDAGGRMSQPTLRVCALYPDLMNIYADRGNIAVLRARCEWRGLGFELSASGIGERLDPAGADLFYMGGGQDRDQAAVARDMVETKRDALHAAADRDAVVLAVCGGYQLLGHGYEMGDEELPGVGLVDLRTVRGQGERLIGNCAIEADLGTGPRVIAGFENHGGRTHLGAGEKPLGRVLRGHGNNGADGFEGVHRRNVIGTYLHGPLLPKNVWLADRLIELALDVELAPLDDAMEDAAHLSARRAAGV